MQAKKLSSFFLIALLLMDITVEATTENFLKKHYRKARIQTSPQDTMSIDSSVSSQTYNTSSINNAPSWPQNNNFNQPIASNPNYMIPAPNIQQYNAPNYNNNGVNTYPNQDPNVMNYDTSNLLNNEPKLDTQLMSTEKKQWIPYQTLSKEATYNYMPSQLDNGRSFVPQQSQQVQNSFNSDSSHDKYQWRPSQVSAPKVMATNNSGPMNTNPYPSELSVLEDQNRNYMQMQIQKEMNASVGPPLPTNSFETDGSNNSSNSMIQPNNAKLEDSTIQSDSNFQSISQINSNFIKKLKSPNSAVPQEEQRQTNSNKNESSIYNLQLRDGIQGQGITDQSDIRLTELNFQKFKADQNDQIRSDPGPDKSDVKPIKDLIALIAEQNRNAKRLRKHLEETAPF